MEECRFQRNMEISSRADSKRHGWRTFKGETAAPCLYVDVKMIMIRMNYHGTAEHSTVN